VLIENSSGGDRQLEKRWEHMIVMESPQGRKPSGEKGPWPTEHCHGRALNYVVRQFGMAHHPVCDDE